MRPSLLTGLCLVAAVMLAVRLAAPATAASPVGRLVTLVLAVMAVVFGLAFWFRRTRL